MNYTSFSYYALVDKEKSPGVVKKIENTVVAAQQNDLDAESYVYPTNLKAILAFFKSLFAAKSNVVMIRFSDLVFPFVFFVMLWLRLAGKKVIIDVPTPRVTVLKEMDSMIRSPLKRGIRKLISYASASWVLMPANLIIQYADEAKWFSLGLNSKTLKMGNGILITDDIPLTKAVWPSNKLNLIAVAQLADWHGYDRMLYALAELKKQNITYELTFTVVGDGEALPLLKKLSRELNLENVSFTGRLTGRDLDKVFENAHIGVASLGLYRKGLYEASDLKTREYMARGLPVIAAGEDPDFDDDCPYRIPVENGDEIASIIKMIKFLPKKLENFEPCAVREYSVKKLSLKSKVKYFLELV